MQALPDLPTLKNLLEDYGTFQLMYICAVKNRREAQNIFKILTHYCRKSPVKLREDLKIRSEPFTGAQRKLSRKRLHEFKSDCSSDLQGRCVSSVFLFSNGIFNLHPEMKSYTKHRHAVHKLVSASLWDFSWTSEKHWSSAAVTLWCSFFYFF